MGKRKKKNKQVNKNTHTNISTQKRKQKQRQYKDSLFRMLFGKDKEALLSLYNALNHTSYTDASALKINTLDSAIYMRLKNDVSFILHDVLNLYEHQSTINPNMPLRNLRYVADIYKELTEGKSVYSPRLIPLPSPRFVVFYNGPTEQPEHMTYRLSDAFEKWSRETIQQPNISSVSVPTPRPTENNSSSHAHQLELIVDVYNINPNHNEGLKRACKLLGDYTLFVESVRSHLGINNNDVRLALKEAIDECIIKDILKEFLIEHGEEIRDMDWLYEYDEEAHIEMIQKEFYEVGLNEGKQLGLHEGKQLGLNEGKALGLSEGRQLGLNEGKQKGIDSVILGALSGGSSPEDIAKITHIPLKQVLKVANTLEQQPS